MEWNSGRLAAEDLSLKLTVFRIKYQQKWTSISNLTTACVGVRNLNGATNFNFPIIKWQVRKLWREVRLTWCISHVLRVSKSNCHSNTEDHEHPIDLRDINLAVYLVRSVNNLHSWETAKRLALVYDRECSTDDCLAPHNRSKNSYYEDRYP